MYSRFGKRVLDLVLASLMLAILSPVIGLLALLIRLKLGSPVLFRQRRPGLHGNSFTLLKFRTMTDARAAHGKLLSDAERLTPFGRLLRASSIDDLPELFNVLRGDMSLVGPRPLLTQYLELYSAEQMRRHDVLPGITGWAQVNGRNALFWEQKFEMDLWYIRHQTLWLDLKIIAITFLKVIRREGIAQDGQATAEAFTGNRVVQSQ